MAWKAETGKYAVTRGDSFLVDPRALVVDWGKNLSRGGEKPPVDEALKDLARDMLPKSGPGEAENGSSGQLSPIIVRPLPDSRLEVVGGFRRLRAALWLIESGTCADFRIKYTISRLSPAESALVNISENIQREDPKPIQLAHAIRALLEDYGLSMSQIAGRLKRKPAWCESLLGLVTLPAPIQASVADGQTSVPAAIELATMPPAEQDRAFKAAVATGKRITAPSVKAAAAPPVAPPEDSPRTLKQLRAFLQERIGPDDPGHNMATCMLGWLAGEQSDDAMDAAWDLAFAETRELVDAA